MLSRCHHHCRAQLLPYLASLQVFCCCQLEGHEQNFPPASPRYMILTYLQMYNALSSPLPCFCDPRCRDELLPYLASMSFFCCCCRCCLRAISIFRCSSSCCRCFFRSCWAAAAAAAPAVPATSASLPNRELSEPHPEALDTLECAKAMFTPVPAELLLKPEAASPPVGVRTANPEVDACGTDKPWLSMLADAARPREAACNSGPAPPVLHVPPILPPITTLLLLLVAESWQVSLPPATGPCRIVLQPDGVVRRPDRVPVTCGEQGTSEAAGSPYRLELMANGTLDTRPPLSLTEEAGAAGRKAEVDENEGLLLHLPPVPDATTDVSGAEGVPATSCCPLQLRLPPAPHAAAGVLLAEKEGASKLATPLRTLAQAGSISEDFLGTSAEVQ